MKIQILDDLVINKIAAGEVVDRPVSVVRELLDNAVDSGADDITISIERGGRGCIEVRDNGTGMSRDDALLALERHATSKISDARDLQSISTYGFRGEALASIAAVSKLILRTRTKGASEGTEITVRGGGIRSVETVAAPPGTDIQVRNLFFNTPARKKFLRKETTEERRIKSWLSQFSLANPSIRFRLLLNGRDALVLPQANTFLDRAKRLVRGNTVVLDWEGEGVSIEGLLGHPSMAQFDTNSLTIQVNGRVVSDRLVLKAIREGFDSTLKDREIPTGCLQITLHPSEVDVNVHPQKSEVRFLNPQQVFQAVRDAVLAGTQEFRTPMAAHFQTIRQDSPPAGRQIEQDFFQHQAANASKLVTTPMKQYSVPQQQARPVNVLHYEGDLKERQEGFRFSELRFVGQVFDCYLLCELQDSLVVVDMHAAHERVNFNKIRNEYSKKEVVAQQLLLPVAIELSTEGVALMEQEQHTLGQLGFEIDPLTESSIAVRSVPAILVNRDLQTFIKELAANELAAGVEGQYKKTIDSIVARIACHASIRSGYTMKREEVYALFAQLDLEEFSAACPHGRPVVVSFTETDVEHWFGRDR